MTWVKIDDSFPDHPKIIGLSDRAFRLHIKGLCYCGMYLTNGFLPFASVSAMITEPEYKPSDELEASGLWRRIEGGFVIHDYLEHQTSKSQVEEKREAVRARVKKYRNAKSNAVTNAFVTTPEDRIQNTEDRRQNTESKDNYFPDGENQKSSIMALEVVQTTDDPNTYVAAFPRVKTAHEAVLRVSNKLAEARANGINAWNLSRLIEDEWDSMHNANDLGGCIALTAWYVSELQCRSLTSAEIGRIGQMTKRFGRIALLSIDEAASKDLDDLVSYAFRIAQNKYKERQGK